MHGVVGAIEQLGNVSAHQRERNHAEVRERGVASADIRRIEEDAAEAIMRSLLGKLGAGIGDGDEVLARLLAELFFDARQKIMVEHLRLGSTA